jgi:L-seryl-tRNA(Ser) seleniumtransferase
MINIIVMKFKDVYEELGIKKTINCMGEVTIIGGSRVDPRVMDAMSEASKSFCLITELNDRASEIIAEFTGAEAGMVTSGAAASMMIAAAACIMRGTSLEKIDIQYGTENYPYEHHEWQETMWQLPDTKNLKNEFVTQKSHRNPYINNFTIPGGKIVWVGEKDGCTDEQVEGALTERTAAIVHLYRYDEKGAPLEDIIPITKRNNIPVIVDDASGCPPRSKLRKFTEMGVDLTCISGGKAIKGPNNTGLLFGKNELIKLARLQYSPHRGIGRPCKVDRTTIIGLLKALTLYIDQDEEWEFIIWDGKVERIISGLEGAPNIKKIERFIDHASPNVRIVIDENSLGKTAKEVRRELIRGEPRILCGPPDWDTKEEISLCVRELNDYEEKTVISKITEILSKQS